MIWESVYWKEELVATAAMAGVVAIATAVFLWSTSSAVALSVGTGSLVSVLQGWLMIRDARLRADTA